MKQIPFVPDIELTDIYGEPMRGQVRNGDIIETVPIIQTHVRFMLERTGDPAFAGNRAGCDAIDFSTLARAEIRDQVVAAKDRGYWLLEDDRAEAQKRATLTPQNDYRADMRHNLKPFTDAIKAISDAPKEP